MAEYQAVIMAAGRGSRMYPLTENIPKCLLPIGNQPLIWYPLNLLQTSGFEEVIVVVLESEKTLISPATKAWEGQMKIDLVAIPDSQTMGTADSLRFIKDKIKKDVLVVSCDLLSDVNLHQLADVHRTHCATISVLLTSTEHKESEQQDQAKKKTKKDSLSQRDIIGIDSNQNRLLFLDAEDDLEEKLIVHKSLLERFPLINIKSKLADAHLYIIKKWVVDFLASNKSFNSIKGELIPYLIKKQYRTGKRNKNSNDESNPERDGKTDIFDYIEPNYWEELSQSLSTSDRMCKDEIRCHCFIMESGLCRRTNTVPLFLDSNRMISKILPSLSKKEFVHPLANVKKSQVGADSMVGEGSSISEKVSIKRSIIGKHVKIGEKVKITNSVIMDHVTIKEGCNIQGSIICDNVHINETSTLRDCQVGESYTVPEASDLKGEALAKGQMNI